MELVLAYPTLVLHGHELLLELIDRSVDTLRFNLRLAGVKAHIQSRVDLLVRVNRLSRPPSHRRSPLCGTRPYLFVHPFRTGQPHYLPLRR